MDTGCRPNSVLEDGLLLCIWGGRPNWQVHVWRGNEVVSERNLFGHRLPRLGAAPCKEGGLGKLMLDHLTWTCQGSAGKMSASHM